MSTVKSKDGTEIFYKDWGPKDAQPIVFHHGWPLSGDDWDTQMLFFAKQGYRVVAHDRRGHGRSTQAAGGHDMDTYAADVAAVVSALGLKNTIHVGHSTGGGEATRYVARHGKKNVAGLVLIGAVPPLLIKTASYPDGTPKEVFDGLTASLVANRADFYWTFPIPFYSYNREGAKLNEAVRLNWWRQAMMGGALAQVEGVKAFSETDFTEDLKSVEAPVLILHGEDDQIVPVVNGRNTAKLVKRGTLKTYPGLPHGMATTHAERVNADILTFIKSEQPALAKA
ncbi:MAG TPA: alpha/beta hydrolase [Hyphomonadaceae bacterium]|nr:alpha/beta hydrolase [Hyphomonadaceae bacterium]